jgi:hypothetical protein
LVQLILRFKNEGGVDGLAVTEVVVSGLDKGTEGKKFE